MFGRMVTAVGHFFYGVFVWLALVGELLTHPDSWRGGSGQNPK